MKISEILVSELMKPAKTITKDTEIVKALHILKTENLDFLSIVDEKQNLIGALSENNFIKLVKQELPSPFGEPVWLDVVTQESGKKTVETIMTTGITTISPNDNVAVALKIMNASGYKLLHVVDSSGKLLGIIRIRDIFEKLLGV
jgi:CBS-domain-containing membrane protein